MLVEYRKYDPKKLVSFEGREVQTELTWEEWAEKFEFSQDPYEKVDCNEYSRIRLEMGFKCRSKRRNEKVAVFWHPSSKLGIKDANKLLESFKDYKNILLIHNSKITTDANQCFSNTEKFHLNIFMDSELFKSLADNRYYNRHVICSEREKQELFSLYNIKHDSDQYARMPLISKTDPPVKFIGGRSGDLIKIYRPSFTLIDAEGKRMTEISYRLVTK